MTWEVFYFICFLVGFLLSLLSFLGGATHFHLPHGHAPGAHGTGAHAHGGAKSGSGSLLNFGTVTAFLAWFGGTGYLLSRYSTLMVLFALAISVLSGLGGATIVFLFLFKFLLRHERDLDPADYNMIGVFGVVNSPVREGGTGEMIFSRDGARRSVAIRSEENRPIARGAEVVVMRFEKGIAYVSLWDELGIPETEGARREADETGSGGPKPSESPVRSRPESIN